jgi:hypothetical protein
LKILIIESHPDDTALSAYFICKHLQDQGHELSLASVATFPETVRDSSKWCESMRINWISTPMVKDLDFKLTRVPIAEVKNKVNWFDYQWNATLFKVKDRIPDVRQLVRAIVNSVNYDQVMTMTGLLHPMHILTRFAVETAVSPDKIIYYADAPYQFRQYGKRMVEETKLRKTFFSKIEKTEVDTKLKLFWDCYPTERPILTWDRDLYYKNSELLLTNKE